MSRDDILLFGGSGFIGSVLARRLNNAGYVVHVLGRQDADRLEHLLPQCGTVVHLASATTPGSSAHHPEMELNNLASMLHLQERMQRHPGAHLIFFSSGGAIYGNPAQLPIGENMPLAPLSYYGAGKAALEMFCQAFRVQGHAVTILRPSNAYGPGQVLRSGFGLVRTMLEHARNHTAMDIWGDGQIIRDYIYIDDVVEACERLIAMPSDSSTYNLGSGVGHSINQVKQIVERVTGSELKTVSHPVRGIDVQAVVLDISRLEKNLSWRPRYSLEEGIRCTWGWLKET